MKYKMFLGNPPDLKYSERFVVECDDEKSLSGNVIARNHNCAHAMGATMAGWNWNTHPELWRDFDPSEMKMFDEYLTVDYILDWWDALSPKQQRKIYNHRNL